MGSWIFFVVLLLNTASAVLSVQMEWGENPDLVDESVRIQGREHIKPVVLLEGETIDLVCQVLFTSYPISQIMWREDGELNGKPKNQTVESCDDYVCVVSHFAKGPVTEEMDGHTVYCGYSKGNRVGRLEADLHVFHLEIETSDNSETCEGNVKLVFKENQRVTSGGANIDQRIKLKITEMMTNVKSDQIKFDASGFSVTQPMAIVKANQAILAMKPKLIRNGIPITDTLDQYDCKSTGRTSIMIGLIIGIVAFAMLMSVSPRWKCVRSFMRKFVNKGDETPKPEEHDEEAMEEACKYETAPWPWCKWLGFIWGISAVAIFVVVIISISS